MKFTIDNSGKLIVRGRWPRTQLGAKIVSIQKWLVAKKLRPRSGLSSGTCALCEMYITLTSTKACQECPIRKITNQDSCDGTPWFLAREELRMRSSKKVYHTNREIRFLISLLPGLSWLRRGMRQEDGSYA